MRFPLVVAALLGLLPLSAQCQMDSRAAMTAAAAGSIIIPEFKVQGVPLRHALSDLRRLSTEADPNGRGIDLVLKSRSEVPFDPMFSLEMHNVSVAQVLNTIASQLNMKVSFLPYAAVLTQR